MAEDLGWVDPNSIVVDRDSRQRREVKISEEFRASIAQRGVLVPLIIQRDGTLVAGERRLTAALAVGLASVPVRYFESLSPTEASIIELEENLKRSDLPWQDMVRAVKALYGHYRAADPEMTQAKLAKTLALSGEYVGRILRVGEDIESPRIVAMPTMETAFNALKRADERRAGDAINDIMAAVPAAFGGTVAPPVPPTTPGGAPPPTPALGAATPMAAPMAPCPSPEPDSPIINTNFAEWASTYTGAPFNFLHCDFPYGIDVFGGQYGDAAGDKHYEDTPDIYFALIDTLAEHLDRILGYSAHIMFWYSMEHHEATITRFRERFPDIHWQKFPLIWAKSDNVGIMPDPKRAPRRVYETCLMGTRGDRFLAKPVSNFYACPTDKQFHPSTKPVPMLRHFFQMFVDNGTRLLDPTCGSGSALRAAASMGASHVLGLEQDPEHYRNAVRAWTNFNNMRKL